MDSFHIIELIGSGSYGKVYKAISLMTNKLVALKVISIMNTEGGVPVEVKYLNKLRECKNIVQLTDHFYTNDDKLVLVFEYLEYDLWKFISPKKIFLPLSCIKFFIEQLLKGLEECHSKRIMHLDIKPSNLLIDSRFNLKLADFGFTTYFDNPQLTNQVISLFYRPPELLMGVREYGPEVDIWSVGCILAEMLSGNYLFAGTNEDNQLDLIFRTFGTPTEQTWPGVRSIPGFHPYKRRRYAQKHIKDIRRISTYSDITLDLLTKMLAMDPRKRISCKEALSHPWFREYPSALPPSQSITQSLLQRPPKIAKINSPLPNSQRIIAHQYYLNQQQQQNQLQNQQQQQTIVKQHADNQKNITEQQQQQHQQPQLQQQSQQPTINKNSVQFLTNIQYTPISLDQSNHTSPSDNNFSPCTEPSSSSSSGHSDYFTDSSSSPISSYNSDYSSPIGPFSSSSLSKRKFTSYQQPLQNDYKRSRSHDSAAHLLYHNMMGTEANPIVIE